MVQVQRIEPGPGQESVWDYPRPPAIEPTTKRLRVEVGGVTIAETTRAYRILETSQPPAYYFPPDDVRMDLLTPSTVQANDGAFYGGWITCDIVGPFKGGPGTAGW